MLPLLGCRGENLGHSNPGREEYSKNDSPTMSPLTYGNFFDSIKKITACKTPEINNKIAKPWGLPLVKNSSEIRQLYQEGRNAIR